ncbi:MAG: hypothetical protein DLM68_17990 [Hyphomicrobiales bacterium]|nr:MAG: hypothetical protein DLM68_17990 [Hyphomicrobiales bacterium]
MMAPDSSRVKTTCALALAVMPKVTSVSTPRNQTAPAPVAHTTSWLRPGAKRSSVACPAGSAAATLKIVERLRSLA